MDDLITPKCGLKTCHQNFDLGRKEWLPFFGFYAIAKQSRALDGGIN